MNQKEQIAVQAADKMANSSLASNILKDLKSMRALWNYLFLTLYVWVVVWLTVKHGETCGNTVIITTGGIVTAVFTNYCWSSHMDKRLNTTTTPTYVAPSGDAAPADDAPASGEGDGNG